MSQHKEKAKKKFWIGVDLGGTKILTALLDSRFEVMTVKKSAVEANRGERLFFNTLVNSIEEVLDDAGISKKQAAGIGMGCPGMISPQGTIKLSPNISFLRNYPLQTKVAKYFGRPVRVENDVNAGLYGEQQFGAAKGHRHVVGIFLGTGVGGAMILDGQLYRGASGAAGEIGHTFLNLPSFASALDRSMTVEGLIGRLAISSEAVLLVLKQKSPNLFDSVQFDARRIKSGTLAKAIRAGDAALKELIIQKAKVLGIAMANAVNFLNPDLIVLGGGLVEALGPVLIPHARQVMQNYALPPVVKSVRVAAAKLGDYAIVKGAAKLVHDELELKEKRS